MRHVRTLGRRPVSSMFVSVVTSGLRSSARAGRNRHQGNERLAARPGASPSRFAGQGDVPVGPKRRPGHHRHSRARPVKDPRQRAHPSCRSAPDPPGRGARPRLRRIACRQGRPRGAIGPLLSRRRERCGGSPTSPVLGIEDTRGCFESPCWFGCAQIEIEYRGLSHC